MPSDPQAPAGPSNPFTAAIPTVRELLDSFLDLKGVVSSIEAMPAQDLVTWGTSQLQDWCARFDACLPSWLAAAEALTSTATDARARRGLPSVGAGRAPASGY